MMEYLDIKIDGVILEVFEGDDYLFLDAIVVDDSMRGKGLGGKALEYVIEVARSSKKSLYGYATDLLGGDAEKLFKWYKKVGFKVEKGVLHNEFDYNIKLYI